MRRRLYFRVGFIAITGFIPTIPNCAAMASESYPASAINALPVACSMSPAASVESCCWPGVNVMWSGLPFVVVIA